MRMTVRRSSTSAALAMAACAVVLVLGYLNKARCAGPPFGENGRSLDFHDLKNTAVCYSDIQMLWVGRGINLHAFPYIGGGITDDGTLTGGAVEYPVLSGVLMWLGGIGSHTDAEFLLHSALLLAPFALLTAWMLGRLAGRWALLWSATPPLVLYAFHNWELPVVATAVAAVFVMASDRLSLRTRGVAAAVLLAIGFCLKLYPGIFVLPLVAYVLTRGEPGTHAPSRSSRPYDVRGAVTVGAAAVSTVVAVNLPFVLGAYSGWRASIEFQQNRRADLNTNSIWYWGLRPLFGSGPESLAVYDQTVAVLSPLLVLAAFALAMRLGWLPHLRGAAFPWIAVSGAMLCGFLLFHKVHSPQYTLWLIPFFVLLRVPWTTVAAYLTVDLVLGIGVFKYFAALESLTDAGAHETVVEASVWARTILLVVLFFAFVNASPRAAPPTPRAPAEAERIPVAT